MMESMTSHARLLGVLPSTCFSQVASAVRGLAARSGQCLDGLTTACRTSGADDHMIKGHQTDAFITSMIGSSESIASGCLFGVQPGVLRRLVGSCTIPPVNMAELHGPFAARAEMHPLGTRSRKSSAPAYYQRNASHGSKDWASVMRSVDQQLPTMDLEQVLEAAMQAGALLSSAPSKAESHAFFTRLAHAAMKQLTLPGELAQLHAGSAIGALWAFSKAGCYEPVSLHYSLWQAMISGSGRIRLPPGIQLPAAAQWPQSAPPLLLGREANLSRLSQLLYTLQLYKLAAVRGNAVARQLHGWTIPHVVEPCCNAMAARATTDRLDSRIATLILYSMGVLGVRDYRLVRLMGDYFVRNDPAQTQHVANALYGLALLSDASASGKRASGLCRIGADQVEMDPSDGDSSSSFGRRARGLIHSDATKSLKQWSVRQQFRGFKPMEISSVSWALTKLKEFDESVLHVLPAVLEPRRMQVTPGWTPVELVGILYAMANGKLYDRRVVEMVLAALMGRAAEGPGANTDTASTYLTTETSSYTGSSSGISGNGISSSSSGSSTGSHSSAGYPQMLLSSATTAQELGNCILSLSWLQHYDAEVLDAACRQYLAVTNNLDKRVHPQELANVLLGCAHLGHWSADVDAVARAVPAALQNASKAADSLWVQACVNMLWALAASDQLRAHNDVVIALISKCNTLQDYLVREPSTLTEQSSQLWQTQVSLHAAGYTGPALSPDLVAKSQGIVRRTRQESLISNSAKRVLFLLQELQALEAKLAGVAHPQEGLQLLSQQAAQADSVQPSAAVLDSLSNDASAGSAVSAVSNGGCSSSDSDCSDSDSDHESSTRESLTRMQPRQQQQQGTQDADAHAKKGQPIHLSAVKGRLKAAMAAAASKAYAAALLPSSAASASIVAQDGPTLKLAQLKSVIIEPVVEPDLLAVDFLLKLDDGSSIVLEVDGVMHFMANDFDRYTGRTRLRNRALIRAFGGANVALLSVVKAIEAGEQVLAERLVNALQWPRWHKMAASSSTDAGMGADAAMGMSISSSASGSGSGSGSGSTAAGPFGSVAEGISTGMSDDSGLSLSMHNVVKLGADTVNGSAGGTQALGMTPVSQQAAPGADAVVPGRCRKATAGGAAADDGAVGSAATTALPAVRKWRKKAATVAEEGNTASTSATASASDTVTDKQKARLSDNEKATIANTNSSSLAIATQKTHKQKKAIDTANESTNIGSAAASTRAGSADSVEAEPQIKQSGSKKRTISKAQGPSKRAALEALVSKTIKEGYQE